MTTPDDRDRARKQIAERGLTPQAVSHLTADALGRIDLDKLAPVKGLLKRFFSAEPWAAADDRALADLVGPGAGWWVHELDDGSRLAFGWQTETFRIDASLAPAEPARRTTDAATVAPPVRSSPAPVPDDAFLGSVVPEATPNPRTIRFVTGPINRGPSRWYASADEAAHADDPRVARLFAASADVTNVLVGPDFVAVGLNRPDQWETMLVPMLRAIEATFSSGGGDTDVTDASRTSTPTGAPVAGSAGTPGATALDRAWRRLSELRVDDPGHLAQLLDATSAPDVATRHAATRLLIDADPSVAVDAWRRLLDDPSRTVRRATVDVMVDASREELRPPLEHALHDTDAWTRWKALRGLVDLGVEASRVEVEPLGADPDFRVRLEAAGALRR